RLVARPVRMPVAEAQRGRGRKSAASVAAAAAAAAAAARRRSSALSEEEEERPSKVQPMDVEDDDNDREEPDAELDEGDEEEEEEEEHLDEGEEEEENDEDEQESSNGTSEPEEQVEPPAFSLATLGLQRVGSAPPPKPKVQKAPILTLNARGMPARIRKKNRLFYDENIINDDKPLRVSLAPKKMPGRPPLSAGGGSAQKAPLTPSKVLKKRKGVVSRYMRSSDGSSSNSASSQQHQHQHQPQLGRHKKTPSKGSPGGKLQASGKLVKSGRGAHLIGKGSAAAAAAVAAAEEEATQAEANAAAHKRLGQSIGLRLRNVLKLPKAHKWAIAEFFYSYVDKPLFESRDEVMTHVNELAPRLGPRMLNRHEWIYIRRRMGRPRRCSAKFFSEERKELDRKRQLIRTLQSRKPGEFKDSMLLSDMPEKIPMPLPLGTKVTARLRSPQDGIFAGTVAAYDSLNAMYRVTFERPGLGTHAIPDYEIVSENFHEMLPLHSFTKDFRPNLMCIYQTNNLGFTTNLGFTAHLSSNYLQKKIEKGAGGAGPGTGAGAGAGAGTASGVGSPQKHLASNNADARKALSMKLNKSDPLLGQDSVVESPIRQQLARHHHHHSQPRHTYSSALLESLVYLQKHISMKADRIERLNKMNSTAELALAEMINQDENGECHRRQIADNFQRQYAYNIVSIEKNNVDLMFALTKVQELSSSLTRNPNVQAMISPTYMREECRAKAALTVDEMNKGLVKNPRMIRLLKNLTTLLILTQNLSGDNKVFEGCLEEVRSNLYSMDNSEVFRKSVQARLEFIAMDIAKSRDEKHQHQGGSSSGNEDVKDEELDQEEDESKDSSKAKAKDKPQQPDESSKEPGKVAQKKVEPKDDNEEEKLDSDESDNAEHPRQKKKEKQPQQQDQQEQKQKQDHADEETEPEMEEHHLEPEPEQEPEQEHEHEHEPEERSPNAAATDDTQITIESMKESEEEFLSNAETEDDEMADEELQQLKVSGAEL
ncbi:hypothetical protein KR054_005415, partial [Drosophila jambulina]